MDFVKKNFNGLALCLAIAIPAHFLGKALPIIGAPVFAIIFGMIITFVIKDKTKFQNGIKFTAKKILQYAVVLLGFGMNLNVVITTGKQSLPIIIVSIATSLIVAYLVYKFMDISKNISILIGVGSSICGGSAVAATAPIIEASEEEVAQAISVIFLFNVLAAIIFPTLGSMIGFSQISGEAFGIFAGTAVNDTSSVTAAASTWDSLYNLGTATLDKAITVKLTRTLAIIPISLFLAYMKAKNSQANSSEKISIKSIFPFFILFFILASLITTIAVNFGISIKVFTPFKFLSKFFIVMAMAAIGLNTNLFELVKKGGKPIMLGLLCWLSIAFITLAMQYFMAIW